MPYEILPDEPIIIGTVPSGFKLTKDIQRITKDIKELLDAVNGPVYLILDLLKEATATMDELMLGTQYLVYGPDALFQHPNIYKLLVISQDEVMRAAYQGTTDEVFGSLKVAVFDTVDDALDYARSGQ